MDHADRPGPEGVFKERPAEISFSAGLESGVKRSNLSGSERPSSLHRDHLIEATVWGGAKDLVGISVANGPAWGRRPPGQATVLGKPSH